MRVRSWGRGDRTVFLLHGFMGSVESWGELPAGLASDMRVIAVDLPGHGQSEGGADPARYSIARIAADMAEVYSRVSTMPAWWLGYSMGGRIALAAAAAGVEMRGLLLESASPGIDDEEGRVERRRLDEERAERLEREGIESFVGAWLSLPLFDGLARLDVEPRKRAREVRIGQDPARMAAWLRGGGAGSQPSFWDELVGIRGPVHLLTGAEDRKFTEIATRMSGFLPDASVITLPGCGHLPHLESPAAWTRWVRRALGPPHPSLPPEGVDAGERE